MRFDILTIFPEIFASYFGESIIGRAREKGSIEIVSHNLRDYSTNKHRNVDDTPYGGGAGMVMQVEPIFHCLNVLRQEPVAQEPCSTRTILFSAKGKRFTQADAKRFSRYDRLILICGRYEGVDERVAQHLVDEEISIGDFVLTGGEIPAMVVIDSITRLLPGVLGNPQSLEEESFSMTSSPEEESELFDRASEIAGICEYPQYTKPEEFNGWTVPKVLLGGNHESIKKWRWENAKKQNYGEQKRTKS